jgi:hypothetical protein
MNGMSTTCDGHAPDNNEKPALMKRADYVLGGPALTPLVRRELALREMPSRTATLVRASGFRPISSPISSRDFDAAR